MQSTEMLVKAGDHNPKEVTLGLADHLVKQVPITVVFFYRESVSHEILRDSLGKVLSSFPIFAGRIRKIKARLCIDCNNAGVAFTVGTEEATLDTILMDLPAVKKSRLVDMIEPKWFVSRSDPVMRIKVTYFACGGMALGICWNHSIGDMHTMMCFLKAWSHVANGREHETPLIVADRDQYLSTRLPRNSISRSTVRYLRPLELLRLSLYMFTRAKDRAYIQIYFSESELKRMKQTLSALAGVDLSRNDVLCAHLFGAITGLDKKVRERCLSVVVNYRSRVGLPDNLLGNMFTFLNLMFTENKEPACTATDLRRSIENFTSEYLDFFSTKQEIEANGGIGRANRFLAKALDPIKQNILITNWANFGVYDVTFEKARPFYFTPFGDFPFPWLSAIAEGFSGSGLIYAAVLPTKVAKRLLQDKTLSEIHKYRDPGDPLPDLARKWPWIR